MPCALHMACPHMNICIIRMCLYLYIYICIYTYMYLSDGIADAVGVAYGMPSC